MDICQSHNLERVDDERKKHYLDFNSIDSLLPEHPKYHEDRSEYLCEYKR